MVKDQIAITTVFVVVLLLVAAVARVAAAVS